MYNLEGRIIGYVKRSIYNEYSFTMIAFIVKYYNRDSKTNNYILSEEYNANFMDPLMNLSSDSVIVSFDDKGKAKVEGIQLDNKDKENVIQLREYTQSEFNRIVVDNNPLTDKEKDAVYETERIQKNKTLILILLGSAFNFYLGIIILNVNRNKTLGGYIAASIFFLIGSFFAYRVFKKDKYKLSKKEERIISIQVKEIKEELTSQTVIFEEINQGTPQYYVYYTKPNSFKIGEIYKININKYKRPIIRKYMFIDPYVCNKLNAFTDNDFAKE